MKNPYEVLGVSEDANEDEIKKAYRKLSRDYHADRNPGDPEALKRYHEVQEAYENITNPQSQGFGGFSPPDFFNDFISNMHFNFGGSRPQQRHFNLDTRQEVIIDFWEAVKGCEKTITVPKLKTCKACNGSGAAEFEDCSQCASKGVIIQRQGNVAFQSTCPRCQGAGRRTKRSCESCQGGFTRSEGTVTVKIPEHISDGGVLRVANQGNEHENRVGNLFLVVRVGTHPIFQRQGDNLVLRYPITYTQAVFGAKFKVPTLEGEIEMEIPKNFDPMQVLVSRNKGFKNLATGIRGDLIVYTHIEVIDPETDTKYKELVTALADWEYANESPAVKNFKQKAR
jgi:molecular chaperone DnaJ